jgi:hypothetical protein
MLSDAGRMGQVRSDKREIKNESTENDSQLKNMADLLVSCGRPEYLTVKKGQQWLRRRRDHTMSISQRLLIKLAHEHSRSHDRCSPDGAFLQAEHKQRHFESEQIRMIFE